MMSFGCDGRCEIRHQEKRQPAQSQRKRNLQDPKIGRGQQISIFVGATAPDDRVIDAEAHIDDEHAGEGDEHEHQRGPDVIEREAKEPDEQRQIVDHEPGTDQAIDEVRIAATGDSLVKCENACHHENERPDAVRPPCRVEMGRVEIGHVRRMVVEASRAIDDGGDDDSEPGQNVANNEGNARNRRGIRSFHFEKVVFLFLVFFFF